MATRNAFTPSYNDVNNAINGVGTMSGGTSYSTPALDGDIIVVPAGTATWTTGITITNKSLTLQGAGIGQTIITGNLSSTSLQALAVNLRVSPIDTFTLSGIEFKTVNGGSFGIVGVQNADTQGQPVVQFRVTNCKFTHTPSDGSGGTGRRGLYIGACYGVIDHCTFVTTDASGGQMMAIDRDNTDSVVNVYHTPQVLGDGKATFIEDCTFNMAAFNDGCFDTYAGSKFVFRYNMIINTGANNGSAIGWHGQDSGVRSPRSFEIYSNTFTTVGGATGGLGMICRGGTGVVWGNTFDNGYSTLLNFVINAATKAPIPFARVQAYAPSPAWGSTTSGPGPVAEIGKTATGNTTVDGNTYGPGHVYAPLTQVITDAVLNSTTTITSATANFSDSTHVSRLVTGTGIPANTFISAVNSSTSATLSSAATSSASGVTLTMAFLDQGYPLLDQPGRGSFPLTNTGNWPTVTTGYASGDYEALDPIYCWSNTVNGNTSPLCDWNRTASAAYVRPGRDYYDNTTKPGYTPYIHPHPLVSGGDATPPPSLLFLQLYP
jgi:hypothetical protein